MAKVKNDSPKGGQSNIILEGCYVKTDNLWSAQSSTGSLLVVERHTPTLSKPPQYILHLNEEGHRTYISSLFSTTTPGTYRIDFKGIRYDLVRVSPNSLCISIGIIPTK